jgi:hypothetical protein
MLNIFPTKISLFGTWECCLLSIEVQKIISYFIIAVMQHACNFYVISFVR